LFRRESHTATSEHDPELPKLLNITSGAQNLLAGFTFEHVRVKTI
jgi:hypothetical protein